MPYDLRTRTALVCGVLALAIAASVLLRGPKRVHLLFAAFSATIGFWYLAQSFFFFFQASIWQRFTAILAILLPQFALNLFEGMVPHELGQSGSSSMAWRNASSDPAQSQS